MSNKCRVAVVGASGYTGDELLRVLLKHPGVELTAVTSRQIAGQPLAKALGPALDNHPLHFEDLKPSDLADRADAFFLALPHGVAAEYALPLLDTGKLVFDLSADFRLKDADVYKDFYGHDHPAPQWLGKSVYGLPEFNAEALKTARLVACPGCYPTSAILAVAPALKMGAIDGSQVVINSLSGISGAGKKADLMYSFCERSENLTPYGVPKHRHIPEIEQEIAKVGGAACRVSFVPHLVPIIRGMLTTASAPLVGQVNAAELEAFYRKTFEGSPFVHILAPPGLPEVKRVAKTNHAEIALRIDPRAGRLIMMSAIDNLGKGAATQAVQAFNVRMGFDQAAGLL